ncbi:MAG: BlaI/MecI/CopY family transcriptional regulator [Bacteroidales bacterium]|jgi:predicted transcriptional regulator|nr:BlaI/MecI/CopY family transcriptional regulator [Bacteroidales bacterium]NLM91411.1 BlaI/MecI/CopY family transcriptional regulator [Bacteroidales bacterium]
MNSEKKYHPTESELEILQVLWEKGEATVREVHEVLEQTRDIGYTTTLKTMQIMNDKGLLERNTSSRTHIYRPLITRKNTQKQFLNKMIDGLFRGSASRMVIGALDESNLSEAELREIQDYLKQFENGEQ